MTAIDPLIARFARACRADFPLDLQVNLASGELLAQGKVDQPFTLIGRDDSCDVTLADPEVHLRHCWLQVIEGSLFALDLGSRGGLIWPSGDVRRAGWVDAGMPVRIGPFQLRVRARVSKAEAVESSADPIQSLAGSGRDGSTVQLEFLNGKGARNRWTVNRTITLVGRSDSCKIHLNADDIATYHCGLVLTGDGLWVVDLSGRGVVVNGERMRVAPLGSEDELRVGRFVIGCRYQAVDHRDGPGHTRGAAEPTPRSPSRSSSVVVGAPVREIDRSGYPPTQVTQVPTLFDEDEVPIGGATFSESTSGLPSSHIMCDAFPAGSPSGLVSNPVLLSAPAVPADGAFGVGSVAPGSFHPILPDSTRFAAALAAGLEVGMNSMVGQIGDVYAQMVQQLQHSLMLLLKMCDRVSPERTPLILRELTRIQELNAEMATLQGEVARAAISQVVASSTAGIGPRPGHAGPGNPTPPPMGSLLQPGRAAANIDLLQHWMQDRMVSLQEERQNLWDVLTALLADPGHQSGQ